MNENRGPWYLLTGIILGAILGVLYAWVVQPVQYTNTSPASLRADFKDQYRALIAAAYAANGDVVRARARLELLQDADLYRTLAEQAQRTLAGGASLQEARTLGMLAVALGQGSQNTPASETAAPFSPTAGSATQPLTPAGVGTLKASTPAPPTTTPTQSSGTSQASPTPRPSRTPAATSTLLPTRTPTLTPGGLFVLESEELLCDPDLPDPLIQVLALNAAGQGVPGVEVIVSWDNAENHFFTGLKPELGLGYADFEMTPGSSYTLRLAEGGQPIPNLNAVECQNENNATQWGTWKLVFVQP